MMATICDDTWNVLNMQHITPHSKRRDYSDIIGGGHKKIKGPTHMTKDGHHLKKPPTPTHEPKADTEGWIDNYIQQYFLFTQLLSMPQVPDFGIHMVIYHITSMMSDMKNQFQVCMIMKGIIRHNFILVQWIYFF